ncbi:mitochondrial peripheral inner membrane protein [Lignoscripta atroalba]|nr:mitochondrial peripheral inner membrane protein [Lignoscripta atroalba]
MRNLVLGWRTAVRGNTLPRSTWLLSHFRVQRTRSFSRKRADAVVIRRTWPLYGLAFLGGFAGLVLYAARHETLSSPPLNPQTFSPFVLKSKERVSSTSSIFTLRPSVQSNIHEPYKDRWRQGIWSVQVKQPQLQIARAYTPLPPSLSSEHSSTHTPSDLRFLIRLDPKGEVSGYLHKLPEGATIDLRGPHIEYNIPEEVEEVVFLAGGTGIAPALQVAYTLFEQRLKHNHASPKMHILWACRRREDCEGGESDSPTHPHSRLGSWKNLFGLAVSDSSPNQHATVNALVKELVHLKSRYPSQLMVDYFVDEDGKFINGDNLENLFGDRRRGRSEAALQQCKASQSHRKLVLVSGPDGFVDYYAGPKAWKNGKEEQGELRGLLGRMGMGVWEVLKL